MFTNTYGYGTIASWSISELFQECVQKLMNAPMLFPSAFAHPECPPFLAQLYQASYTDLEFESSLEQHEAMNEFEKWAEEWAMLNHDLYDFGKGDFEYVVSKVFGESFGTEANFVVTDRTSGPSDGVVLVFSAKSPSDFVDKLAPTACSMRLYRSMDNHIIFSADNFHYVVERTPACLSAQPEIHDNEEAA